MSLTQFLLANKVIHLEQPFENETAFRLYEDMTANAVFSASLVSDQRGDLHATEDTLHEQVKHQGRVSETAFFYSFSERASQTLEGITKYVAELLNVDVNQFEPWQCTRYFKGGLFDYHDDCGNWASNERLYSVMYTIRAADFGGGTDFRRLNITVPSVSNSLLIWRNLNEDYLCDGMAEHSGMPVGNPDDNYPDEKMIVVTWIRKNKYVS